MDVNIEGNNNNVAGRDIYDIEHAVLRVDSGVYPCRRCERKLVSDQRGVCRSCRAEINNSELFQIVFVWAGLAAIVGYAVSWLFDIRGINLFAISAMLGGVAFWGLQQLGIWIDLWLHEPS